MCDRPDYVSSAPRYDHFDTSPYFTETPDRRGFPLHVNLQYFVHVIENIFAFGDQEDRLREIKREQSDKGLGIDHDRVVQGVEVHVILNCRGKSLNGLKFRNAVDGNFLCHSYNSFHIIDITK